MVKSKIRVKPIARAFHSASAEQKSMHVQLARLAVLYEDLLIEFRGAEADDLKPLDSTSVEIRRLYFVRRALATLTEVDGALHKLGRNAEFKRIRSDVMSNAERTAWDNAVKFFGANHARLKDWRNDVGGHLHDAAAEYALDNINDTTAGTIEVYRTGNGATVKMRFVGDLIVVALTKARNQKTAEQFLEEAFTFLKDAVGHAINSVQVLVNCYLFDRFI